MVLDYIEIILNIIQKYVLNRYYKVIKYKIHRLLIELNNIISDRLYNRQFDSNHFIMKSDINQ